MRASGASLIIPAENQVRELAPKLLLACVAVERGFRVFLGSRTKLDFRIASFPRSIYLCKSMTPRSVKMFRIMRSLGHEIAVWDEEALVHPAPPQYYARRISAEAMGQVSILFAWGEDNAELFRKHPEYPGIPIHVTGNPRIDLLRPELSSFYEDEASRIRGRFGEFILVNTNFAMVNAFLSTLNLLQPGGAPGQPRLTGAAAVGWSRDYVEGLAAHKQALFDRIRELLPALGEAFPEQRILVRPHPSEDPVPWESEAKRTRNVEVVREGNVIPWLMAAKALVHNGCTTAIEAFLMGVPAVAYRPVSSEHFDNDFPNRVSHQVGDFEGLRRVLQRILAGELGGADGAEQRDLVARHISARDGALASDRIVDVLEESAQGGPGLSRPPLGRYLGGWVAATRRSFVKQVIKARIPGHRNNPDFQRHRFGGVSVDEMRTRIARLTGALGRFGEVKVRPFGQHIFELHS